MFFEKANSTREDQKKDDDQKHWYADVLCVSPYKPMGYISTMGVDGQGKPVASRYWGYVPQKILDSLLNKEGVYVISPKTDEGLISSMITKPPPENKRLILTEKEESREVYVFHMDGLLELLKKNKSIVFRALNLDSLSRNNTLPWRDDITEKTVIEFVKLVSRKTEWDDEMQALIDACFADLKFLIGKKKDQIKLTPELEATYAVIPVARDKADSDSERFKIIQELAGGAYKKSPGPPSCPIL